MPGLEIVAGVAAIVSAFNGSVTLYRSWRDKRRDRLENAQNQNLEPSLTTGGTTVQREYDTHFAKLGRQFAVGDDRARADLAAYVIKVQHIIITLMTESNTSFILVLPSLPTVYATSEETRLGVVSALAEQHQRMAQAKPLRSSRLLAAFAQLKIARSRRTVSDSTAVSESHSTPESSICEENDLEESKSANTYYGVDDGTFRCRGCGFSGSSQKASDLLIRTCKGNLAGYWFVIKQRELFKCHFNDTKSGRQAEAALYCPICYDGSPKSESVVRYTILQLVAHIKDTHTYDDLETRDLVDEITR